jgi:hypothetical protein
MKMGYQLFSVREECESRDGMISVLEKLASYG